MEVLKLMELIFLKKIKNFSFNWLCSQFVYLLDDKIKNNVAFGIEESKIDLAKKYDQVLKWLN